MLSGHCVLCCLLPGSVSRPPPPFSGLLCSRGYRTLQNHPGYLWPEFKQNAMGGSYRLQVSGEKERGYFFPISSLLQCCASGGFSPYLAPAEGHFLTAPALIDSGDTPHRLVLSWRPVVGMSLCPRT